MGQIGEGCGVLFAWQRTHRPPKSGRWVDVAPPEPGSAEFYLSDRYAVRDVLNLRTGEAPAILVAGEAVRLPEIGEDVIALVTEVR